MNRRSILFLLGMALLIGLFLRTPIAVRQEVMPVELLFAADLEPRRDSSEMARWSLKRQTDQSAMAYPWRVLSWRALRSGYLPLWNPYALGGTPFFANGNSGVLAASQLVASLFPLEWSYVATAATKLLVAGVGMGLFLRALRLTAAAVAFGSVAFAFSGFLVVWQGNVGPFLPWLPWTAKRWVDTADPRWLWAAAIVSGAQFYASHLPTSIHLLLAGAGYAVFLAAIRPEGGKMYHRAARAGGWLAAVCAGAGLAALQLLPTVENILASTALVDRAAGFHGEATLPAASAITWLVPNAFGNLVHGNYFGPPGGSHYNEHTGYVGIATLALAGVGLVARRALAERLFFLGALVGSAGVVYGVPPLSWLTALPGLNLVGNTRLLLVAGFSLGVLGAVGVDRLARSASPRRIHGSRWSRVLIAALLLLLLLEATTLAASRLYPPPVEQLIQGLPVRLRLGGYTVFWATLALLWATLSAGALLVVRHGMLGPRVAAAGLVAVLVADLFTFGINYPPAVGALVALPDTRVTRFLHGLDRPYRLAADGWLLGPNAAMVYQVTDMRGYDIVYGRRTRRFLEELDPHNRAGEYGLYLMVATPDPVLLSVAAVQYYLTPQGSGPSGGATSVGSLYDAAAIGTQFERAFEAEGVTVWRNLHSLPYAFIAESVQAVKGPEDAMKSLRAQPNPPPRIAVIEEESQEDLHPDLPVGRGIGSARIVSYGPGRIVAQVFAERDAVLVVNEAHDGGWRAYVDGVQQGTLHANYLFQAVVIPAGAHSVELVYLPLSFQVGLAVTVVSVLVVLGGLALALPRRRKG